MKTLGHEGEDLAVGYLKDRGFTILCRNYKTPLGEADILARDKETTVFVEVKARSSTDLASHLRQWTAGSRRG